MATLKHKKMQEDAHRKMVEKSILEILELQRRLTEMVLELLKGKSTAKPKLKGVSHVK